MKVIILFYVVNLLCSVNPQEDYSFGYEFLDSHLEHLDQKLTDLITVFNNISNARINELNEKVVQLTDLMKNNQIATENKITNLNSSMINRLLKLEATGDTIISSHRSTENLIHGIKSSISTLDNQSKQILKNHHDLTIHSCSVPTVPGIYSLQFPRISVFCHPIIYGGGWLVIQHRLNGDTNFNQNWYNYRTGFGTVGPSTDFWLGLEAIHQITNGGEYELRVDVRNDTNEDKYAQYSQFKVSSESDGYRLTIGGYSGTAGDEMSFHNQKKFSTYDVDNDESSNNCAKDFESGWWFKNCRMSNLNGPYKKGSRGYGIEWGYWADAGTYSRMMIRRK